MPHSDKLYLTFLGQKNKTSTHLFPYYTLSILLEINVKSSGCIFTPLAF